MEYVTLVLGGRVLDLKTLRSFDDGEDVFVIKKGGDENLEVDVLGEVNDVDVVDVDFDTEYEVDVAGDIDEVELGEVDLADVDFEVDTEKKLDETKGMEKIDKILEQLTQM